MKEKKKNNKSLVIVVLLLLFTISIGYALISRNFNLNGTVSVKGNQWDIKVNPDDVSDEPEDPSNPPQVVVDPNTGDVTITYTAALNAPGDEYVLHVPVKNGGTLEAVVSDVTTTALTSDQQKYLTYSVTDESGADLKNQVLSKTNGEIDIKVSVKYRDDNQKELPVDDVNGIQLRTVVKFQQKR